MVLLQRKDIDPHRALFLPSFLNGGCTVRTAVTPHWHAANERMCLSALAARTETDELVERQREDRLTKRDVKM